MPTRLRNQSTRRRFVGGAALAGAMPGLGWRGVNAEMTRQDATPTVVGEAEMPTWRFIVVTYQDPYPGTMLQPQQPEPGRRYIGAEVEIRNESDRPLAVSSSQIRLRDADAIDYGSGGTVGSDPRLFDVNTLPGERVRGWVWFGVPEAAEATELVYVPAAPQLRVGVGTGAESGG